METNLATSRANGPWFIFVGGDSGVTQPVNAVPPMNPHFRAVFKDHFSHQSLRAGEGTATLPACCRTGLVPRRHRVQELPLGREHLLSMLGKTVPNPLPLFSAESKTPLPPQHIAAHSRTLRQCHPPAQTLRSAHLRAPSMPCVGPADAVHSLELLCTAREEQEVPPSSHLGRVWGGFLLYPLPGGGAAAGPAERREEGGGEEGVSHHPQPKRGLGYCASAERNAIRAAGREASKGCEGAGGLGSGLQGVEATRLCPCISPPCLPPSPQPRVPTCCPPAELLCFPLRASFNYCCW